MMTRSRQKLRRRLSAEEGTSTLTQYLSAVRSTPFAVGEVITCDVGDHGPQRGFVMKADHPRYKLRFKGGATLTTSHSKAFLIPRLKGLAPHQDDPFNKVRKEVERGVAGQPRVGSYGVHGDAQRESLCLVDEAKVFSKAVKADAAEVPMHLWNDRVTMAGLPEETRKAALDGIRQVAFQFFMSTLLMECVQYMAKSHGKDWLTKPLNVAKGGTTNKLGRDRDAMANMLWHSTHTNCFEYNTGLRLIHFRFPKQYQKEARVGVQTFFEKTGPTTQRGQPTIDDPVMRAKVMEKIVKVIKRGYLTTMSGDTIKSYIKYFAVPKGEDNIRMVYDATANKLNDTVWVPTFWLPTIDTLVRNAGQDSWMKDRDVNYQLHEDVWPYTGVDLSCLYASPKDPGPRCALWDRNLIGFEASPYNSIKMALVAEEVCKGNRLETGVGADGKDLNPFQWKTISLNLPGTKGYNPRVSWI